MIKARYLIIALLTLIVITLLILKFTLGQPSSAPSPTVSPSPQPTANPAVHPPTPPYANPTSVNYHLTTIASPNLLPSTFNIYTTNPTLSNDGCLTLAHTFHTNTKPTSFLANTTTYFQWTETLFNFYCQTKPDAISYLGTTPLTNPAPPPQTAATQAQAVLNQLYPYLSNINLSDQGTNYINSTGHNAIPVTQAQNANLTQLHYDYVLNGLPLLLNLTSKHPLEISISQQGLVQLNALIPPQITSSNLIALTSLGEALQKLSSNQGILTSATPNVFTETTPNPDFTQVTVRQYDIVYLYSQGLIQPYYRFYGTAPDSERSGIVYQLEYLVPGTSNL